MFSWIKDKIDDVVYDADILLFNMKLKMDEVSDISREIREDYKELKTDIINIPNDAWSVVVVESDLGELNLKYQTLYKIIIYCHLMDMTEANIKVRNGSEKRMVDIDAIKLEEALGIKKTCNLSLSATRDAKNWNAKLTIKEVTNSHKVSLLNKLNDLGVISFDLYESFKNIYAVRIKSETCAMDEYVKNLKSGSISDLLNKKLADELIDSFVTVGH